MLDIVSIAVLTTRCLVELLCTWCISRVFRLSWRLSNPFIIVWLFSLPILALRLFVGPLEWVDGGYSNIYFQKAVMIETVTALSSNVYLLVLILLGQKVILRLLRPTHRVNSTETTKWYSIVGFGFLVIGFISVFLLAAQNFGVVNWIISPRIGYQYYRAAEGHWYTLAVNCMAVSTALILLFANSWISFLVSLLPLAFLVYLLGSKAFFLQFATFVVIALLYKRVRAAIFFLPIIGIFAGFGMLQNFAQVGFSSSLGSVAKYFDYFGNSTRIIRLLDLQILDFFDGDILTSSYWSSVPRALVPSKPYVYGPLHLNEVLWPGLAKLGHTPAFTSGIDAYADFGWWGVILQPLLGPGLPFFAVVYIMAATVYHDFPKRTPTPIGLLGVLVAFAPGLLTFLGFPWNIFWLFIVFVALIVARPVRS